MPTTYQIKVQRIKDGHLSEMQARILRHVLDSGACGISARELAERIGAAPKDISRNLVFLSYTGQIASSHNGHKGARWAQPGYIDDIRRQVRRQSILRIMETEDPALQRKRLQDYKKNNDIKGTIEEMLAEVDEMGAESGLSWGEQQPVHRRIAAHEAPPIRPAKPAWVFAV